MKKYLKFIILAILILFLLIPVTISSGPSGDPCPEDADCFWDPIGVRAPIGVFLLERIFNIKLDKLYIDEGYI